MTLVLPNSDFQIVTHLNKVKKGESESHSVMSDSLRPHGLQSMKFSRPEGSRSLLQGIFPILGSNPGLPHCRQSPYQLSHKRSTHLTGYLPKRVVSRISGLLFLQVGLFLQIHSALPVLHTLECGQKRPPWCLLGKKSSWTRCFATYSFIPAIHLKKNPGPGSIWSK